jgi:hypothetical protein
LKEKQVALKKALAQKEKEKEVTRKRLEKEKLKA